MTVLLEASCLTKLYGVVIGVNDITLRLQPGVIGLLGPNGAGKSTLLKLITGQLRPTEGDLSVLGEVPWANRRLFRRIGFCPEQDAFYDSLSGLEFVTRLAQLSGLGADAGSRSAKTLERVGAGFYMHRPIATYSKGMRQRTKIAQALVHEPELLILDEPLIGTDPIGRREIIDLVAELGREGRSILVSSHVLHEVQAMTDAFVLIYSGRVLASGDVHEIRAGMANIPYSITLRCADPRRLAAAILGESPVLGVELLGTDGLQVRTHEADALLAAIPALTLRAGVAVHEIRCEDDRLEAVFHHLVSYRR